MRHLDDVGRLPRHHPQAPDMTGAHVVYLGLVCWLASSLVFGPVRNAARRWAMARRPRLIYDERTAAGALAARAERLGKSRGGAASTVPTWRDDVVDVVTGRRCAGVGGGLALAAIAGGPFDVALVGWVLSGLLYKAIADVALEVTSLAARVAR